MQNSFVVNVIGPDRPGLVQELSRTITAVGGNWEGSRMIQLAGQFAGMVQVVIATSEIGKLEKALTELESAGLRVSLVDAGKTAADTEETGTTFVLEVVGQDRQGIVSSISETLASHGANVIELATDCSNAPWSGEKIFTTHATVIVPNEIEPDFLRTEIESIASDLMVEIHAETLS